MQFKGVITCSTKRWHLQGEHKVFPWLQTFIARKLRGI